MGADQFWAMIEASRRGPALATRLKRDGWARLESERERTAEALTEALKARPPEEIRAFQTWFRGLEDRLHWADVWAVACLVMGGCSDDGFDYFKSWLISRGRAAFEAVLANPDNLVDVLKDVKPVDDEYMLEFEEFAYCAAEAYEEVTGKEAPSRESWPELAGEGAFDIEDGEATAKRCPRLGAWARKQGML